MTFTIEPWTTVRLKSNEQEMIVSSCTRNKEGKEFYTCKWQDENNQLNMTDFQLEDLIVIT